jgi:hypothetical protein
MSTARALATLPVFFALAAAAACADSPQTDASPGAPATGDDAGQFGTGYCDGGADLTGCPCQLGETRQCYNGPASTRGVGLCKDGIQKCQLSGENNLVFGPCTGAVLPGPAQCDGLDHA